MASNKHWKTKSLIVLLVFIAILTLQAAVAPETFKKKRGKVISRDEMISNREFVNAVIEADSITYRTKELPSHIQKGEEVCFRPQKKLLRRKADLIERYEDACE